MSNPVETQWPMSSQVAIELYVSRPLTAKEMEGKTFLHKDVHFSIIYNNINIETNWISKINGRVKSSFII